MPLLHNWSIAAVPLAMLALAGPVQAQVADPLFFEGDMVRGAAVPSGAPCVLTSQFKRQEQVVFRIRVVDSAGKSLDDKGLKSLVVELSDGKKIPMRFHGHPPKDSTDFFWVGPWIIPEDYPTGSFAYKVTATDLKGAAQTWLPFKVAPSQFTVIAGDIATAK
jgi:hypothetical protein